MLQFMSNVSQVRYAMLHSGVVQIAFYNNDHATAQTSELYFTKTWSQCVTYYIVLPHAKKCDPMNKYEKVSTV